MLRLVILLLVLANAGYYAWTQGFLAPLGLAPVEQSEPERLNAQIRPESVRLLNGPKGAASAELPVTPPPPTDTTPADTPAATGDTSATTSATASAADATALETATTTASVDVANPPPEPARPAPARTACWLTGGFTTDQADTLRAALTASGLPRSSWQLTEARTNGRWVIYMGRYNDEQLDRKKAELKALGVSFRTLPAPLGPGLALGTFSSEAAAEQGLQDLGRKGIRTARVVAERAEGSAWTLRLPAITDAQLSSVEGLGTAMAGKKLQACD